MARPPKVTTESDKPPITRTRAPRRKTVKREMTDAVVMFVALASSAVLRDDPLTTDECGALSKALFDASQANPYIANMIYSLTQVGGVTELVAVVGAIAAKRILPRLEKARGIKLPQSQLILMGAEVIIKGVETGPTLSTDRADGQRENDAGTEGIDIETVRDNADNERRPRTVDGMETNTEGVTDTFQGRNGRALHPETPRQTRRQSRNTTT